MKLLNLVLLSLILILSGCDSDKIELRLNLEKEDRFSYQITTTQKISQSLMGQKIEISQMMQYVYDFEVIDASSEFYTLEVQIKSIKFEQNDGMTNPTFSTENLDDSLSNVFSDILSQKFLLTITPKGKITDFRSEKMILPTIFDESIQDIIDKQLSTSNQKNSLAGLFLHFPEQKVSKNSKWKHVEDINDDVKMRVELNFVLQNLYDVLAIVSQEGNINATVISGTNLPANASLAGESSGEATILLPKGILRKSFNEQTMGGELTTFGMRIPLQIVTTTEVIFL